MRTPRIAILTRAGWAYHLQVGWGFFNAIENSVEELGWRPILFFCKEADERVMYEQMEEIKRHDYELIISIGAMRTRIASDYIKEHNWDIPLIFCGVTDPVGLGVVPSLKASKGITGVMREEPEPEFVAEMLYALKPGMKRLLIPYHHDAEGGLLLERLQEARTFFAERRVVTSLLPIAKVAEFPEILKSAIPAVDTLWCPGGDFVENFHETLGALCNQYGVTFFANNDAITSAAIVLGDDVKKIGEQLFTQVYKVLEELKKPEDAPLITIPNERKVSINMEAAQKQKLNADPAILFCLKSGFILEEE